MATKTSKWIFDDGTERDAEVGVRSGDTCILLSDFKAYYYSGSSWEWLAADLFVSSTIVVAPYTVAVSELVRYDPSGGSFQLDMPAPATLNDRVGFKNLTASSAPITLSGNGSNVEDPAAFALSASVTLAGPISLSYQYDGAQWIVVSR